METEKEVSPQVEEQEEMDAEDGSAVTEREPGTAMEIEDGPTDTPESGVNLLEKRLLLTELEDPKSPGLLDTIPSTSEAADEVMPEQSSSEVCTTVTDEPIPKDTSTSPTNSLTSDQKSPTSQELLTTVTEEEATTENKSPSPTNVPISDKQSPTQSPSMTPTPISDEQSNTPKKPPTPTPNEPDDTVDEAADKPTTPTSDEKATVHEAVDKPDTDEQSDKQLDDSSPVDSDSASKPSSPITNEFNANAMIDDEAQEATTISKLTKSTEPDLIISENITDNSSSNAEVQTDFVDAEMTDASNQAETLDDDPIAGETVNTESILPEEEKDKYIITHFNEYDENPCGICDKHDVPKYLAQRDMDSVYMCSDECLQTFKDKNLDNFIEKILRLRSFATQDKPLITEVTAPTGKDLAEEEFEFEMCDNFNKDVFRNCGYCKKCIDIDNYISWEVLEFCNEGCLLRYQRALINSRCARCKKIVTESVLGKYCVRFGNDVTQFCCTTCLLSHKRAYKFCAYCQEDMRNNSGQFKNLCSRRCLEACHVERAVKEHNLCSVCHQLKPTEIKVKLDDKTDCFCGEPCFVAYKFVNKIDPAKCSVCPVRIMPTVADLMIYANDIKNFLCSKECQKIFLIQQRTIVLCGHCNVKKYNFDMITLCDSGKEMAYACCNICLQVCLEKNLQYTQLQQSAEVNITQLEQAIKYKDFVVDGKNLSDVIKVAVKEIKTPVQKIIMRRPKTPVRQRNVGTLCKPRTYNKCLTCGPDVADKQTQTEEQHKLLLPVPVPIFVPVPMHMYVDYVPMPTPIPIPLPVPIFIPTSRKSAAGILKEIQKIKNRVPADPLEAEILKMAEMAAGDKKEESSSESEPEIEPLEDTPKQSFTEAIEPTAAFGEDVLTMALKMANEFEEPTDGSTTAIAESSQESDRESMEAAARIESIMDAKRKSIRDRKPRRDPLPTDDSNLNLKYSFGVNAWKQWVTIKNLESQKMSSSAKQFKTELLQLTADDLNISLCLFVKEVRKPSGVEYAPDTIYYLCLGIQQYLYENNRIDNIFCDPFYEKFTDSFNEVCQKFANLYSDSQYIVTRVEEEHLWESKQLGAHSPLVLLNTLMFFNTKHFSLTTVEEHFQLSFSHIMKHWKRNPNVPGSRNVLLRFYPPQAATEGGRKKKVYEQQENDVNPLRCPVKLYEFFLSKCPESVKTRNDVFYLQPERSCVPDSPVWYSTMALTKEPLEKMLNRVKMVKEINVALLTS